MSEYGPEFDAFVKKVRENLVPQIEGTDVFVSITPSTPEEVDVKFAVELGLAIMYNKPIVAVVQPGTEVSEKLVKVADRIMELDIKNPINPEAKDRLMAVVNELAEAKNE